MSRTFRVFILCLFIFVESSVLLADQGQQQPSLIKVDIVASSNQELIKLEFNEIYNQIPSINFETGSIAVTLPGSQFDERIKHQKVNDRFIQAIHFAPEGKDTIVVIQFSDSGFNSINRIKHTFDQNILYLYIDKKEFTTPPEEEQTQLTVEEESLFNKIPAEQPKDFFSGKELTKNLIIFLTVLMVMLLCIYLIAKFYNRYFLTKFKYNKNNYSIKVKSSYHISPKQKIVILEINGISFACGVTPQQISVISKVTDNSLGEYLKNLSPKKRDEIDLSELKIQYLAKKNSEEISPQKPKKSNKSFSTELIERVKRLKPID